MYARAKTMGVIGGLLWLFCVTYGELFNGAPNSACYPFLGCDEGFFGYDALEHFLFGLAVTWGILWVCGQYPRYSILQPPFLKTALVVVASVALLAVIWEIGEWFRDAFLLGILHQKLVNLQLHINYLAQPSNFDTMGDLSFSLFGAGLALLVCVL